MTVSNTPNISFFEYNSRHLRTFNDGEIAFCLIDVLNAMNSKTTTTAATTMICDGMGDGFVFETFIPDSIGREQITTFVREAALTYLLSRSRTKAGKTLNKLIHSEILPSVRKTGSYVAPTAPTAPTVAAIAPAVPTNYREAMMLAIDLYDSSTALKVQIESDAPLVAFANAVQSIDENILVGTLAKSLGIGPNNLMGLLRANKILMTSTNPAQHNIPFQLYINRSYFVVDENTIEVNGKTRLSFTTKVTPKGQVWLSNKYSEWQNIAA